MPLVMVVVQYGVTFVLVKALGAAQFQTGSAASPLLGFASGGVFALVSLGLTFGGLWIVYDGTQDFGLTFGYFVIHWIEGYLLSFVVTAAVLASLGLHSSATAGTPAPITAPGITASTTRSQTAGLANRSSSQPVSVRNGQGIYLQTDGHVLDIALPFELKVNGQLITTEHSVVYVHCIPLHGRGFSLPPQTWTDALAWRLSSRQLHLKMCYGTVTLSHSGVNEDTNMYGFNLLPWRIAER